MRSTIASRSPNPGPPNAGTYHYCRKLVLEDARRSRLPASFRCASGAHVPYGFLPPHPANPPTKRPIVALMKQARAFGLGIVIATQNPMDLDYRALGHAGLWCIGRLQTDADCARVMDGLACAAANGGRLPPTSPGQAAILQLVAPHRQIFDLRWATNVTK